MTLTDARDALSSFAPDAGYRDAVHRTRLVKEAGDGARYYVLVKSGVVSRIGVEAPKPGLESRLTRLWGAPKHATSAASESLTSWSGASWRVDLACREQLCRLAFHEPLTAAFFGGAVAPPGPLAGLRAGMTRAEVAAIAPRFAGEEDVPAGPEDVRFTVELERTGHLRSVLIGGLPDGAGALLAQAWGAPAETGAQSVWVADRGWRAVYDEALRSVHLIGSVPAAQLLGSGPAIAALAAPILGATIDQIAARYPGFERSPGGGRIALPPIEGALAAFTAVGVAIDPASGRAKRLAIELPFDSEARRDELVRLLEAKWGKAVPRRRGKSRIYGFAATPVRIEALEARSALALELEIQ